MTKIEKQIIERIERAGGVVVVCPYGMYTRSDNYVAFCNGKRHASTTARDAFLKKYCTPFTKAENEKVSKQRRRNLNRYARLAKKCIDDGNFETAGKLIESAGFAASDNKDGYYRVYYKLKGKLTDGK